MHGSIEEAIAAVAKAEARKDAIAMQSERSLMEAEERAFEEAPKNVPAVNQKGEGLGGDKIHQKKQRPIMCVKKPQR